MRPVSKALWFIESHYADDLSLEEIAEASGVGRFHLSRAFEAGTGLSVMRYVRARRLADAARALAAGAPDILQLALTARYASHEAFTRAFRYAFGMTPEQLRAKGDLSGLSLMEPHRMDKAPLTPITEPRLVDGPAMTVAGLKVRYAPDAIAGIPSQWQSFNALEDTVPGRTGDASYGVCMNGDGTGHITEMRDTFDAIWNGWFPKSGRTMAPAPLFERYGPEFDAETGNGGFEIWIPLKPA